MEYTDVLKEIHRLSAKGAYKKIVRIADDLDWKENKDARVLLEVSRAYEQIGRTLEAENLLKYAYNQKIANGKIILFRLLELCAINNDSINAEEIYTEFIDRWPKSRERLAVDYYISRLREDSVQKQISLLEKCCQNELREDWLYHLAVLYDQADREIDCVNICHDIIFYFGTGEYAKKAVVLRKKHGELTQEEKKQIEQAENRINALKAEKKMQKDNLLKIDSIKESKKTEDEVVECSKELIEQMMNENLTILDRLFSKVDIIYKKESIHRKIQIKRENVQNEDNSKIDISMDKIADNVSIFTCWIRDYAYESGAELDESAYVKVAYIAEKLLVQNKNLTYKTAMNFTIKAIKKARQKTFFDFLITKYNEEGRLILYDKHFEV